MAKRVFGSQDRNQAHQRLAQLLAKADGVAYECREDPNDADQPYQVWDGPAAPYTRPGTQAAPGEMLGLEALAKALVPLLLKEMGVAVRSDEPKPRAKRATKRARR